MKPFIKWAGGKYRLANKLILFLPAEFNPSKNTYIEPMAGSGGFFFNYAPKQAYLSDINQNLITTYNIIKNDVNTLILSLKEHQELHNKEYFYDQRKKFNELIINGGTDTEIASLFIYLNRTCFNGLYRENSKGEFNVPIGSYKNPTICNEENLLSVSKILQSIEIHCHGYEESISNIGQGDFVYIDPPYIPIDPSSFTKYSKNDFGEKQHVELSDFCDTIDKKGAFYMLSNSDTELTDKIYLQEGRFKENFLVSRTIASKAKNRNKAKEVVITNYKMES
jgi:DNA adenine methylase